jgi:hypothetical protein
VGEKGFFETKGSSSLSFRAELSSMRVMFFIKDSPMGTPFLELSKETNSLSTDKEGTPRGRAMLPVG